MQKLEFVLENGTQNSLVLGNTNGLSNPGLKTRSSVNQQELVI